MKAVAAGVSARDLRLQPVAMNLASLSATREYDGSEGCVVWEGYVVPDKKVFHEFLNYVVAARLRDTEGRTTFEEELQGLATTGVATEFLAKFLAAVPEAKSWEVGEALAEAVLSEDDSREVVWPWNELRDRRMPQASLPGADLVGFCRDDSGVCLLFGEVKTSTDSKSPPQVMHGPSGMAWQLEGAAVRLEVQHALLRWLRFRCQSPELEEMYREAAARYLRSEGRDVLIVGVLLRDTQCREQDVERRGRYLAGRLDTPTRVEVLAWYLPIPIKDWPTVLGGSS